MNDQPVRPPTDEDGANDTPQPSGADVPPVVDPISEIETAPDTARRARLERASEAGGDRVSRLSSQTGNPAPSSERPRLRDSAEFVRPDGVGEDATVREYETRYRPRAFDLPAEASRGDFPEGKQKNRMIPRSYTAARVSDEERLWAAVAHASIWITLFGGIFTIGAFIPVSIFIPLVIYFLFRRRSDFVAFHALQAFTLQLIGVVGAGVLLAAGGFVWGVGMVIAILALVVLVGFVLVPLWGIVGVALLLVTLIMPIAALLYGTLAAVETYNGRDYHYPYIARWVDRQLAGGFLNAA